MKKLWNKYFDWVGVENEGNRRLFMVIIIFWFFYLLIQFVDEILRGGHDINEIIFELGILLIIPFFSVGFVIKTFNWVKDGFKKKEGSV